MSQDQPNSTKLTESKIQIVKSQICWNIIKQNENNKSIPALNNIKRISTVSTKKNYTRTD